MLKRTLIAGVACLLLSCGNEKKEEKNPGISDAISGVSNLNKIAASADQLEEQTSALKKLTPLTNEELKAVVPETLNGLKRTSFTAGALAATGLSSIDASYGDDSKYVKVSIMDGAGESGSAIVSLVAMSLKMDTESESNGTKTKTTEVNGIRSITEDTKSDNSVRSSVKFLVKDRYAVSLDGEGYSLSELESFVKELDLSKLK